MKHYYLSFFIATLMSMAYTMASAHDIAVANSDGKTIYYKYTDGTSVSVTYFGTSYSSYSNEYTGDVVIPETVTYGGKTYSVTSIGYDAFCNRSGLTSVTIPNSVTSIGYEAFHGCSSLTSVIIPNSVTSIGSYAFRGCSGLTSVTIPNSVTSIGSSAFQGCSGLTSVTIGNSVTSISDRAFNGCSRLTSVTISSSVTSIGDYAFSGTAWYDNQPDGLVYAGNVAYKYKGTMPANTSITLKEGTVGIASQAFNGCSGLTSVTIPNSVTSIGEWAFSGCSGLTSVTIPNSVTSIGSYAFNYCSGLTSVTIPNSVTSIGGSAFSGCSGLTSITWNAKNYPEFSNSSNNPFYDIRTQITEFVISDEVTSIPAYMCYEMSNLKSMTIPNSVTSIGDYAFYGCSGLKSITWNAKNYPAFSSYSSSPFYNIRTQITEFIIGDDVTSIPSYMCYGMSNLESVTIPNSVTSIDSDAFSGCSGLKKVIVPNIDLKNWCSIKFGNTTANPLYYAHHLYSDENTEITELVIPDDVTSINSYAFYGCSGLTSVTIPNSVTSIGSYAFRGCSSLTSVTIPNSVTSIGQDAFYGCSRLTSVTIPNSVTSIDSETFYNTKIKSLTIGSGV